MLTTQTRLTDKDLLELETLINETLAIVTNMVANEHFRDLDYIGQGALMFLIQRQLERIYKTFHKKGGLCQ